MANRKLVRAQDSESNEQNSNDAICKVHNSNLVIRQALPPDKFSVIAETKYDDDDFTYTVTTLLKDSSKPAVAR